MLAVEGFLIGGSLLVQAAGRHVGVGRVLYLQVPVPGLLMMGNYRPDDWAAQALHMKVVMMPVSEVWGPASLEHQI